MAQIPKGSLGKGPYKPICRDCAIYFSTTVFDLVLNFFIYHKKQIKTRKPTGEKLQKLCIFFSNLGSLII